ncbi:hypothetical protein [Amycolatopsis xylanica]|nr:hypothetical protein [Amycolatopsis xylanica]
MIKLVHSLTDDDPAVREEACGGVTDWVSSFSRAEVRLLTTVMLTAATVETTASCRECQLHAVYELADTTFLDAEVVAPIRELDFESLGPSERDYVSYLWAELDVEGGNAGEQAD